MEAKQPTDRLHSLLQGELAAIETYRQALRKVGAEPGASDLWRTYMEHREAARLLRQHEQYFGGPLELDPGAWGTFAKAVEGVALLFGNKAALLALREGEELGIQGYQKALGDERLADESKLLISTVLLPQTREHVLTLNRLLDAT